MSLLFEIADRADVPLEGVVRVLTREPVSEAVKERVLAVLDELEPEQTRVLQRFALAAVHDAMPRPSEDEVVEPEAAGTALALPEAVSVEVAPPPQPIPDLAPLAQLGPVLGDLAEAVRELRHETDAERRERVDDLAVLIDLITQGWQGLDRRLGRLERQLARVEAEPRPRLPAPVEPPPVPAPGPPPPPESGSGLRGRLPIVAALLVGIALGAAAALDLPSRSDVSPRASTSTGERTSSLTATTAATSSVLGEAVSEPPATSEPPVVLEPAPTTARTTRPRTARTTTTAPTASRPAPTTATTQTQTTRTTTDAAGSRFRPSRNWAWPPVAGADYYLVEFFRDGKRIYRARPAAAQLRLPDSVVFTPGDYRWRVRPGEGAPTAGVLDDPIVDSGFTVAR